MSYIIDKSNDDLKLGYYNVNIVGLNVTPKNRNTRYKIKASKVIIIDPELSTNYIKRRINSKIEKLISFMLKILNDSDTSDGDAGLVLDEIHRLKGIICNKYKEHMKVEEYKALLSKIIILEDEFKRNYNQKMYINSIRNQVMNNYYDEERTEGRGM